MTSRLCQRHSGADRTIRLFSGGSGRSRQIDANPLDRRERTRVSCRRALPIRQLLLWECHYDEGTVSLPLAGEPRRPAACPGFREARRIVPHIVLHDPCNSRRLCVLGGAERCANDFLP
ncbi:hypothetical protein J2785_002779 [Burkholderia ambifaria]|nr:hypothetical protein [Burkholderia ambifaria]MDR6499623.1 hypothetical protein [Burkholderia ambifaria]